MQGCRITHLLLGEIVRKVCDHDLVLGWNAVGWRTTLLAGLITSRAGLRLLLLFGLLSLLTGCLVSGVGQGKDLLVARSLRTFLATGLEYVSY
jgi:hypothetical protein